MKNFVVIGGGTVGWLAASYLRKKHPLDKITVIESSKIGIIGAGESTTSNFIEFLKYIDISPLDMLNDIGGTIKTSTKFTDWNKNGGEYYSVFQPWTATLTLSKYQDYNEYHDSDYMLYSQLEEDNIPLHYFGANKLLTQTYAPFYKEDNKILPVSSFTLNINGTNFSQYLKKLHKKTNIKLIDGIVKSFDVDVHNNINNIILESGENVAVDFVVDCSGMGRLTSNFYHIKWLSYQKYLSIDSTIPFFLPPHDKIPSYINIAAMKYGWMFYIPMQDRYGAGYNFCSNMCTPEQACEEVETLLKHPIDIIKHIKYESGCYEKCWFNNCLTLGMASGFLEPMAASNISIAIDILNKVDFRKYFDGDRSIVDEVNNLSSHLNDLFLRNVYFRYITNRTDTLFWQNFNFNNAPESLKSTLDNFFTTKDFYKFCADMQQTPIIWLAAFQGLDIPEYKKALSDFRTYSRQINTIRVQNKIIEHSNIIERNIIDQRVFFNDGIYKQVNCDNF